MRAVDSGAVVGNVGKVGLQGEQKHRSEGPAPRNMLVLHHPVTPEGHVHQYIQHGHLEAYHHWKVGVLRLSGQRLAEGGQLQASH